MCLGAGFGHPILPKGATLYFFFQFFIFYFYLFIYVFNILSFLIWHSTCVGFLRVLMWNSVNFWIEVVPSLFLAINEARKK